MAHHPILPPSSFPMFKRCARFTGSGSIPRGYSDDGTLKHELFENAIKTNTLTGDVNLDWACGHVRGFYDKIKKCDVDAFGKAEKLTEEKIIIEDDDLNEISFGSADLIIDDILFDLKNGEARDYSLQCMMYARGYMQRTMLKKMYIVELYPKEFAAKEYEVTYQECVEKTDAIIKKVYNPLIEPNINEYCKWCGKVSTCKPILELATLTQKKYAPEFKDIEKIDFENVKDSDNLGLLYDLCKLVLSPFVDMVDYNIKKYCKEDGIVPTGYKIQNRKGLPEVKDINELYKNIDLSSDEFLDCCKISLTSLQKKLAMNKKEFDEWIQDYIIRKDDTFSIIKDKTYVKPDEVI